MAIEMTPGKPFAFPTFEDYSEACKRMDEETQQTFKENFGKPFLEEDIKDAHRALDAAIAKPGATIAIAAILNDGIPTNDGSILHSVSFLGSNGAFSTNAIRSLIGAMAMRLLETIVSGEPENASSARINQIKDEVFEELMLEIHEIFQSFSDPRNQDLKTHIVDQLRKTAL